MAYMYLNRSLYQDIMIDFDFCMPLKEFATSTVIHESLASSTLTFKFFNPTATPLEFTYSFPKVKGSIVTKLEIKVGDEEVIEAKIVDKKKAETKYDDAIASGH